jgi:hypothetical protein
MSQIPPSSPSSERNAELTESGKKARTDLALVESWFVYRKPSEHQTALMQGFGSRLLALAKDLVINIPDSRERAIALTELRKVRMLVNQAIVFGPEA